MSMDTRDLAHPKPRPAALDRSDRKRARARHDEQESDRVRARAGGRCESCGRQGPGHVHHLRGGHGVRGRGESASAAWKVFVCAACHEAIHRHVLHVEGQPGQWTFRREQ